MSILTTPSNAFPVSLAYITIGTLIDIWTIVAMVYYPPETRGGHFFIVGSLVTGIALLVIGVLLGPIGRAARHAEMPPSEVTQAVTEATTTAAANPPPVIAPMAGSTPQTGEVIVPSPTQQKPAATAPALQRRV
jgi:hypothetical protein